MKSKVNEMYLFGLEAEALFEVADLFGFALGVDARLGE